MQTQQPRQREGWRRRREKYLRESGRHVELMKEGYECGTSSKGWAVIVGRGERGTLERHALNARLFLDRTDVRDPRPAQRGSTTGPVPEKASTRFAPGAEFVLSRGER